jgi:hypothetical protein
MSRSVQDVSRYRRSPVYWQRHMPGEDTAHNEKPDALMSLDQNLYNHIGGRETSPFIAGNILTEHQGGEYRCAREFLVPLR